MSEPGLFDVVVRGGEKSAAAFRTISEVAGELDVPPHVLRFWETKFSQVKPMKRGGGRRYYRPEDVDLLRRIRRLLYGEGYTIKGVQKLLRERSARSPRLASPARDSLAATEPAAGRAPSAALAADDAVRTGLRRVLRELEAARELLLPAKKS